MLRLWPAGFLSLDGAVGQGGDGAATNDGEHSGRRRRGGAADAAQRCRRVALRGPEPSGRRAQRRDEQVEPSVGDDAYCAAAGGRFAVVPATGAERLDGERRAPRG